MDNLLTSLSESKIWTFTTCGYDINVSAARLVFSFFFWGGGVGQRRMSLSMMPGIVTATICCLLNKTWLLWMGSDICIFWTWPLGLTTVHPLVIICHMWADTFPIKVDSQRICRDLLHYAAWPGHICMQPLFQNQVDICFCSFHKRPKSMSLTTLFLKNWQKEIKPHYILCLSNSFEKAIISCLFWNTCWEI